MFCSKCGALVSDGAAFCSACGNALAAAAPAIPAEQAAPAQPVQPAQPAQPVQYVTPVQQVYPQPRKKIPGRALGITALILGIVGILFSWSEFTWAIDYLESLGEEFFYDDYYYYYYSISDIVGMVPLAVMNVLAFVFGFIARKKGYSNGFSITGVILGCIGLALFIAAAAIFIIA